MTTGLTHTRTFLDHAGEVARQLDAAAVERLVAALVRLREDGGRLFVLGVGGSAGNASHAVNDFRKLTGIEAYAPTDNVSELTARTNDDGWETVFVEYLRVSRATARDAVMVFSVGGGDTARNVSTNLVHAVDEARQRGMKVLGVVGRDGGHTKRNGDEVIVIPTVDAALVTPLAETFQAVIWHCLVSHPDLQQQATKWQAIEAAGR
jgi:D-sedoheptulose 7-phosphate isomerase